MNAVATRAHGVETTPGNTGEHYNDNGDDGEVIQLRERGTDVVHVLPAPPFWPCFLRSPGNRLELSEQWTSCTCARLRRVDGRWVIGGTRQDIVLRQDDVPCVEFALVPGSEIGIGARTLIAESPRWAALRSFCFRVLGWDDTHAVERALRSIRSAMLGRGPLVLRGQRDLVPIAVALHRRTRGDDEPFILAGSRRINVSESVRSPAHFKSGVAALEAAAGGTLCIRSRQLPRDTARMLEQLRARSGSAQLVICMERMDADVALVGPPPISIPSLEARGGDLARLAFECGREACVALNAPLWCFSEYDAALVATETSLEDIEKAAWRMTATNLMYANISSAASLLGMAPVSLARWLGRRSWRSAVERGVVSRRERRMSELVARTPGQPLFIAAQSRRASASGSRR